MLLDLNFRFVDLKGKTIDQGLNAAEYLAEMLAGKTEGITPGKAISWAIELYKSGVIDIDKSDLESLEKFIEKSNVNPQLNFSNLLAFPLIEAIKAAKDTGKKDKVVEMKKN